MNVPSSPAPLLQVQGVTLQYRTEKHLVTATYRVSFDVHRADRFVLLGPSGCGKSTLLKAVGGYMAPTEGGMRLKGLPIRAPGWGVVLLQRRDGASFTDEELALASDFGRLAVQHADEAAAALNLQPREVMMVAAHSDDLRQAASIGLRTAHVARPGENGPGTGELAPRVSVDFAATNMEDLASQLGV